MDNRIESVIDDLYNLQYPAINTYLDTNYKFQPSNIQEKNLSFMYTNQNLFE